MKQTRILLFVALLLPVLCVSQQLNFPDFSAKSDFKFFAQQLERTSPLLQKLYAANVIKADMTEEEAVGLIRSKLQELDNAELNRKYEELNPEQLVRIGIILYVMMNGLTNTGDLGVYDYKSRIGAGIGVFMMYTLANFVLMPELTLLFRSFGQEYSGNDYIERFTYLTLALTAMYMIRAETFRVLVGLSPMIGYALSGIYKSGDHKEDIEFGDNGAKRINFGIGLTAGVMLRNALIVRLVYNFGLSKLYPNADYRMYMFALAVSMPLWTLSQGMR